MTQTIGQKITLCDRDRDRNLWLEKAIFYSDLLKKL